MLSTLRGLSSVVGRRFAHKTASEGGLRVCVVGSGPAGFYTADELTKQFPVPVNIDIVEKLPTPYGLVRFGVAPDHPEVKYVMTNFDEILQGSRCRYFGNVEVGKNVTLEELRERYDAVVLAYGAAADRVLGVPGEELGQVFSARSFVGWYNGAPEHADDRFDLSGERALVIGQGNVALDVARILQKPIDELMKTDICRGALDQLAASKIREIHIVGRRGPVQAAFTTKELRESTKVPGCNVHIHNGFPIDEADRAALKNDRPLKRRVDLLEKIFRGDAGISDNPTKALHIHFFRNPVGFTAGDSGLVGGVDLSVTQLDESRAAVATGETEHLPCDIVFRSIGYKSIGVGGHPMDNRRGCVPNSNGRVMTAWPGNSDGGESAVPGLYVSGWLKRGPSGIIGTNKWDAEETVAEMKKDWDEKRLCEGGREGLLPLLEERGVDFVNYDAWKRIEAAEDSAGAAVGKPREKFVRVSDMLAAARSH